MNLLVLGTEALAGGRVTLPLRGDANPPVRGMTGCDAARPLPLAAGRTRAPSGFCAAASATGNARLKTKKESCTETNDAQSKDYVILRATTQLQQLQKT
jgi:hypothetical protein